jgi:stage II sporulation protein P
VYALKSQQYIWRYVIAAVSAVVFIILSFLFIRWLYWDNSSDAALTAFTDYGQEDKVEKYAENLYINIINSTIPAAKVNYESKYGQKLPGFAASTYSKVFNGMNFDIKNPRTYFSFVFTAFSQYDPQGSLVAIDDDGKVPNITNFDEAPEGDIYFSEIDEYRAEEAASGGALPTEGNPPSGETTNDYANISDPARLEIEKKLPSVLLLHTHSTESYTPYLNNNFHSLNDKENVIQVGRIMMDVIESKYKYNVIHDVTKHDRYSYADSYINSQKTIISQLEKNKSVKVVLDVHRDAMEAKNARDAEAKKADYTTTINGKSAAKVMLVIGGGNKNYAELQKFAVYIQKKMDKLYPGLFYKIVTKPGKKYNQYYRDHSMLIEVGSTFNTDQEAKYSAELMGNVLGEVLKELDQ